MKQRLEHIKKSGFKAPDGYFDSFEPELMERLSLESKLPKVSATGFKTPDDYFENLESQIMETIAPTSKAKVFQLPSRKTLVYISGIAAAVLVLFAIVLKDNSNTTEFDFDTVEAYISEEDIDTYELAELLTEDELDLLSTEFSAIDFSEEHLESYLLENVDLENIIEQ